MKTTIWRTERGVAKDRARKLAWTAVYSGTNEQDARRAFTETELQAAGNGGTWTEIRLWRGVELMGHVYWHRPYWLRHMPTLSDVG